MTPASRLGEVGVVPAPLTFPLASWQLPQTVTVSANNDATVDSSLTDTVTSVVTSADPVYNGRNGGALHVTVTDNDGNADLAIALGDAPSSIVVGQVFNSRYVVSNNGPTLSTGATVTIPALPGSEFVSASNATCTSHSGSVTCQLAGLASGAQITATLNLRALSVGTHSHTLTLAGQQPDANAANNSAVRRLTVN